MTRFAASFLLPVLLVIGCDGGGGSNSHARVDVIDDSVTRLEPFGWLGAKVQPLTKTLTVDNDGKPLSVGGVVLREIDAAGALAASDAQVGDTIVRVGETWVPVVNQPTLEVIELVETAVSSGQEKIEIACYRDGAVTTVEVPVDQPALEIGLPVEVERFDAGACSAVARLCALQKPDGGFPAASSGQELATDSIIGLALIAAGAKEDDASEPLKKALAALTARLGELTDDSEQDPLGLVYALMFHTENVGSLPAAVLVAASTAVGSGPAGGMPGGMPPGGMQMLNAGSPEELAKLMQNLGGEMTVFSGSDAPTPTAPGSGGAIEIQSVTISGGDAPPNLAELMKSGTMTIQGGPMPVHGGAPGGGEGADLATLLAKHAPEHQARLDVVRPWVEKLVAAQKEDGTWSGEGLDDDVYTITCHALVALGMAQRVGLEVPEEPLKKALDALRPLIDDGKLAALVARGADRRFEAGRAASGAWALSALDAPDDDELLGLLRSFSDDVGRFIVEAPSHVAWHLIATGAIRRSRGLAAWQSFYDEFRLFLVASQHPGGGFAETSADPGALEKALACEAIGTALGTLLLSMQSERVPVLLGRAENPLAPRTNSQGKRIPRVATAVKPGATGTPGKNVITDPAEAAKLLEKLGVEGGLEGLLQKPPKRDDH